MALTKITSTNIQPGAIESSSLETSGATAGTYGAAAKIPVLSVNAQGIVYAITEADVAGVTDFTYNSSTEVLTISTADGSTFNADISTLASQTYVDTAESDAVTTANAYTDTRESAITTAYQAYADQAELDAVTTANAYTDQEVAALVDSSPAALDTLNELAAALGDDPSFATTVSTNIGTKADKTTTITASTGLSGGGDLSTNRSIAISNTGVTAGSYGTSTAIPVITVNAQGQITSASTTAITVGDGTLTVNSGTGLSGSGTFTANQTSNGTITLSHADTSSQASVNNSGANVIQDVTLDGFGHVTGLGSVDLSTQFLGINAKAADSDLLDGLNSTQFLRSDANDTTSGNFTIRGGQLTLIGGSNSSHEFHMMESEGLHGVKLKYDGFDTNVFELVTTQSGGDTTVFDFARGSTSIDFKGLPTVNSVNLQTVTYDSSSNDLLSSSTITGAIDDLSGLVAGTRQTFTATSGQTVFTMNYSVGALDVFMNGLKLQPTVDYTATNGTSFTLTVAAEVGDIVDTVSYGAFSIANHYTTAEIANHNQISVDGSGVIQGLSATTGGFSGDVTVNSRLAINHTGTLGGGGNLTNWFLKIGDGSSNLYLDTNEILTDSANLHIGASDADGKIVLQTGTDSSATTTRALVTTKGMIIGSGNYSVPLSTPSHQPSLLVRGAGGDLSGAAFNYIYTAGSNGGIQVKGNESAIEVLSTDNGSHGSSILLRGGNKGFALNYNPDGDGLELLSFTASADDFNIHDNNVGTSDRNIAIKAHKSGEVSLPEQPAFSVWGDNVWDNVGNPYPAESEAVMIGEGPNSQWNTVDVNQGGHFNISNGRFTAPVDGLYFFSFQASLMNGDGSPQDDNKIALFKNGAVYRYLFQDMEFFGTSGDNIQPFTMSISYIIPMSAGNYVHAGFATNITARITTAVFSGYKVA